MTEVDINAVMDIARKVFRDTRSYSSETFQDRALTLVKEIIPFDFCKWGTGIVQNEQAIVHSVHLDNLDDNDMTHYLKYQGQDPILAKMISTRDKVVTYDRYEITSREKFIRLPIYYEYCKKIGSEQLISTMVPEPISNLFSVISFGRHDYDRPFTTSEKQMKTLITPVLTEARRQNIFINMIKINDRHGLFAAISDTKGILHEAEPAFTELMLEEWPEWRGPLLNVVPENLLKGRQTACFKGKDINIDISTMHDLVLLQAYKRSAIDKLTPSERKVVTYLLKGLSDKEIAKVLHISPKTVGHHLQSIYKKTNLSNRSSVIAKFASSFPALESAE